MAAYKGHKDDVAVAAVDHQLGRYGVPGGIVLDIPDHGKHPGGRMYGVEHSGDDRHVKMVAGVGRQAFSLSVDVVGVA